MDRTFETLDVRNDDGVLLVTLNRPDRMNAFTVTMADELEYVFRAVNEIPEIDAIVVTGSGRAFCAGMDLAGEGNPFGLDESMTPTLADMDDLDDPDLIRGVRDTGGRVTLAIYDCLKPVIAAINGAAVGIGATMTLAMDARLASSSARVGLVFGRLGIVPEAASSWFLPRIVGLPRALRLAYRADILDAATAQREGLVDEVVDGDVVAEAVAMARSFTSGRSQVATAMTRQMILRNAAVDHPREAHRVDSLAMFHLSQGDGAEGVRAFREKRDAHFTGRVPDDLPPFVDEWLAR